MQIPREILMKVALFITCLADTFYPRTGIAVVSVLEKLGCEVAFPEAQTCCGQPMWNNGYREETCKLARQMIDTFEPYDYVITPSGSCAAMIRDYYLEMFEDDPKQFERAKAFCSKTFEFVEFLVNELKVDLRKHNVRWDGEVTYHYSCHLRGIGITDEAVQLMNQIEGLEYRPLEKADQCCGFGGTFAIKYPKISGEMVRDKVSCIQKIGAGVVISNDSGCTMNLSGSCRRESVDVQFKSLAEIIAEGMGLLEPDSQAITP